MKTSKTNTDNGIKKYEERNIKRLTPRNLTFFILKSTISHTIEANAKINIESVIISIFIVANKLISEIRFYYFADKFIPHFQS